MCWNFYWNYFFKEIYVIIKGRLFGIEIFFEVVLASVIRLFKLGLNNLRGFWLESLILTGRDGGGKFGKGNRVKKDINSGKIFIFFL